MKIEGELKELEQAFLKRLFSKSGGYNNFLEMEDITTNSRNQISGASGMNGGLRSNGVTVGGSIKNENLGIDELEGQRSLNLKPKRITSAPDLSQLNMIYHKKSTYSSLM